MSRPYISDKLRDKIANRADLLCEYCLISEGDTFLGCQVDHIISIKHGGATEANNLAFACVYCNRNKGSDLGSISRQTGELVIFFNPRTDRWNNHFQLQGARIEPITPIGEVTARILGFNEADRILERQLLINEGRYPTAGARKRMNPSPA
ncbi:HNH endonuclease [Capilliphycus salinus ALCB114379]|uniref:HNH endonuclease n=1 Tax=Capilliphycus salinus TaxID=2768948 RepID=UPI0039A6BC30